MTKKVLSCTCVLAALAIGTPAFSELVEFQPDHEKSRIDVDVEATVGSFVGRIKEYQAAFQGDLETLADFKGELSFDFKDLETGKEKRNEDMREWMGYESHPRGRFVLKEVVRSASGTLAVGTLEAVGVQRPVEIPVTLERNGDQLSMDGRLTVNYQDFGLDLIRMALVLTVNPEFDVIFHFEGPLKPVTPAARSE